MYNRYKGNSGAVERVYDKAPSGAAPQKPAMKPAVRKAPPPPLLGGSLRKLLPKDLGELETEDILLALILYLMYRESGDRDLLIIMGALFLL